MLFCNNKLAIDLSKNPKYPTRIKHINIQYYFVRDYIKQSFFNLVYINTKEQLANALTKPVNINIFNYFIQNKNIDQL